MKDKGRRIAQESRGEDAAADDASSRTDEGEEIVWGAKRVESG